MQPQELNIWWWSEEIMSHHSCVIFYTIGHFPRKKKIQQAERHVPMCAHVFQVTTHSYISDSFNIPEEATESACIELIKAQCIAIDFQAHSTQPQLQVAWHFDGVISGIVVELQDENTSVLLTEEAIIGANTHGLQLRPWLPEHPVLLPSALHLPQCHSALMLL
jgi:hypothetical protein